LSELSQRLNQLRTMLDDLVEAETLVGSIGELLAQRNALREQVRELGTEIATKRQAVEQEVASLDADLATRQRAFATEIATKRQVVEQEVGALDADLAIRQRAFADEIARMEEQTAAAKAEQARVEHELQDVHMRLDHTRAVYSELRKKFA
jgi:chromosome segregation ATPase